MKKIPKVISNYMRKIGKKGRESLPREHFVAMGKKGGGHNKKKVIPLSDI